MKKPAKTHNTFTSSEVGVLIEGFRSEIRVIAEGQTTLTKKVDMMYEEMGRQREDIWMLKTDMKIVKEDVKVLKEDVSVLKVDMKIVKSDTAEIKEIIGNHDKRLSKVESIVLR